MTTKKPVIIIVSVMASAGLLVGGFAAAIAAFAFYQIGHSDAARTAKDFLKANPRLQQDIGTVKDFGSLVSGSISIRNSAGYANLKLKVIGEKRAVNADVELVYQEGRPWRVTAASYKNEAGERIQLLDAYESRSRQALSESFLGQMRARSRLQFV